MAFQLGMRDDGWVVIDDVSKSIAAFGGLDLAGLTIDEAHVMLGLCEAYQRGVAAERRERLILRTTQAAPQPA